MTRRLGTIRTARDLPDGPLDPPGEPPFEDLPYWADGVCDRCGEPVQGLQEFCPSCRVTEAGEAAERAWRERTR